MNRTSFAVALLAVTLAVAAPASSIDSTSPIGGDGGEERPDVSWRWCPPPSFGIEVLYNGHPITNCMM